MFHQLQGNLHNAWPARVFFAVKHAVEEARGEVGKGEEYFVMSE